ncbi:nitrite reductase small subunit NirD [Marinilongibacter aquaticus]|uniref:nitrite reductase small subunit NirD n=1 Tax=Marinilongibacter aquaticus TaxID=2975157 RepID=UPI0021BD3143|nr:nitrite reductase small subunit NirD [Marinilongibacter aquaticus]UBM57350.1 nitrite reductase small subunit NirD [Marinilongibacter aquaticus]
MENVLVEKKWVAACAVEDVPENGGVCVLIEGEQIAVYNFVRRGAWFATQNLCPHKQQMALSRGMIGELDDEPKVACPFHKKNFSLQTGACLSGEEYQIKTYPVKIESNTVFIEL